MDHSTINSFTRSLIVEELRSNRCRQYAASEVISRMNHAGMLDNQTAPLEPIRQMVKQEMEKMANALEKSS